jgi:hypothetical protein
MEPAMFNIVNTRTNRKVRDGISGKPLVFVTTGDAEKTLESQNWYFNNRPENRGRRANPYKIVEA